MSIDRDAIAQVIQEHSYAVEEGRYGKPGDWADRILALMRPVEGVTLTPAAAGCALAWLDIARQAGYVPDGADRLVAARLRASS